jgi:hypothetical protein
MALMDAMRRYPCLFLRLIARGALRHDRARQNNDKCGGTKKIQFRHGSFSVFGKWSAEPSADTDG